MQRRGSQARGTARYRAAPPRADSAGGALRAAHRIRADQRQQRRRDGTGRASRGAQTCTACAFGFDRRGDRARRHCASFARRRLGDCAAAAGGGDPREGASMTPAQIERVFGLGRLKMATGEHVEVFREAVAPGERRRYTKRFLATSDADFGQWTEREWRILARLIGHGIRCVPDVVQFDGGAMGGTRRVQTYYAGVTVDQWATLLPVSRDGAVRRHVFEDCAHWWALAHYCLAALDEIHSLQLVHLDVKGDNICIPYGPANFDPEASGRLYPVFPRLALIDFAFSLVSRENLSTALPIGWQKDYDYQSPRLLKALDAGRDGDLNPTKELDWRCDLYSLAAMLKRYLPSEDPGGDTGWTPERFDDARTLIFRIRECHDRDNPRWRPHEQLMDFAGARLAKVDLAASLNYGWTLARAATTDGATSPITPITRIAPSIHAAEPIRIAPSIRAAEPVRIATRIMVPTAVTAVRGGARTPA